jgi:hypothetical protein
VTSRARLLLPLAVLAAAPALPGAAAAAVRAVLVGVSDYAYLDTDLMGPRNDVRLMAETLIARGVSPADIMILAEPSPGLDPRLPPPEAPTRAAILSALDRMAAATGPDDTLVFYFSGHGSLAPDRDGDEGGGPDAILLPADTRGWNGALGAVENAIADDEFRTRPALVALLARGAAFVGILDACHAATGFRTLADAPGQGVARYVEPAALGVPEAGALPEAGRLAPPPAGDFVFLYSSQSDQRSFEYPLGDPGDPGAWHGEFTRQLAAVLSEAPGATWAQVLAAAADAMRERRAVQTPDGEGPLLDAAVFGEGPGGARRHPTAGDSLAAGLVHGITEGAVLVLHDRPAGGEALARARAVDVTATAARLEPLDGAALPEAAHAELVAPGPVPPFALAPPVFADDGEARAGDAARPAALAGELAAAIAADPALTMATGAPDAVPVLTGGTLALAGPDGVLDPEGPGSTPRLRPGEPVAAFLARAAHAHRLRRALAEAERAAGRALGQPPVAVTMDRIPGAAAPDGACAPPDPADPAREPGYDPAAGVGHCDALYLTLSNRSQTAQDVTVLYIAADLTVVPIWPVGGVSNRLPPARSQEVGMQILAPDGMTGLEEIVVVAVAAGGAQRADLTFLADPQDGARTRATEPAGAALAAALDPEAAARGFTPSGAAARPPFTVLRARVTLVPAHP